MRRFRTLFPTLAAACLAAAPAAAQTQAPDRDPAALRQMAEDLAYRYLDGWSSGNAQALADVQALYGPKVNFYGRVVDQSPVRGETPFRAALACPPLRAPAGHAQDLLRAGDASLPREVDHRLAGGKPGPRGRVARLVDLRARHRLCRAEARRPVRTRAGHRTGAAAGLEGIIL
jgi:hypothetical protein